MTVLIPLVDIDGETNGTAMWPRSHHGDGWKPGTAATGLRPPSDGSIDTSGEVSSAIASDGSNDTSDATAAVSPVLRAGDALLFDARLLHRALANKTAAARPIVYLALARPWFRDVKQLRPSIEAANPFARVVLATEHVPVAVGAAVHLLLGGVWARGIVAAVQPSTEVRAGTPWRRSVRMGRVVMDATGEEKEGDMDELLWKGHFVVEPAGDTMEGVAEESDTGDTTAVDTAAVDAVVVAEEEAAGEGAEGASTVEPEQEEQEEAPPPPAEGSPSESESSSDDDDDDDASSSASSDDVASIEAEAALPLRVSRRRRACAVEFREEGFTIAGGALTAAEVAQTRAVCDEARATAREAHRLDLAPGRLDLLMPAFATAPFRFLHAGAPWMSAARALLGDDCSLFTGGVLYNEPGAGAGNVHLDGDHLLETPAAGAAAPPPHCLTVFIPLIDVDGAANGTALWPRSHHGAGWAPPDAVDAVAAATDPALAHTFACPPAPEPEPELGRLPAAVVADTHRGKAIAPALRAGDALLFDFRLLHKALANGTGTLRPVVYLIIARRWFRDCDNWPDVAVSLAFDRVCLSAEHSPLLHQAEAAEPEPATPVDDELVVACEDG